MATVKVYNMEGAEVGSLELNDEVFGVDVNTHVMHMAVVSQLANKRQGTQSAKTRAEVRGGGRKPWRQKTGFDKITPVEGRRSCIRTQAQRLLLQDEP